MGTRQKEGDQTAVGLEKGRISAHGGLDQKGCMTCKPNSGRKRKEEEQQGCKKKKKKEEN